MKLCVNSRDELFIIELDEVACFQADGNYTNINYMGGQKMTVSVGLSKMEMLVSTAFPKGKPSPFCRLGRSLIVNQSYLVHIDMSHQKLILSDFRKYQVAITVSKALLKSYKTYVEKQYMTGKLSPSTVKEK